MLRVLCAVLALCVTIPVSTDAVAGCTDPAAPGVNWRRCYHDGRDPAQKEYQASITFSLRDPQTVGNRWERKQKPRPLPLDERLHIKKNTPFVPWIR